MDKIAEFLCSPKLGAVIFVPLVVFGMLKGCAEMANNPQYRRG